jgi:hypothetical protein
MTNELERFARLAAVARRERAPHVDVSAGVLERIRAAEVRAALETPLLVISGLSLLAASVGFALAWDLWSTLSDPLSSLLQLTAVLQ